MDQGPDALLDAAQGGDSAALNALLRQQRDRVFKYGLRVCQTTEDAEDAVQETLWAASRHLTGFRRSAAVTTWLFTIVRNYCLRLMKREPIYADLDEVVPGLADPRAKLDDEVLATEISQVLAKGLASLEPLHREVILLRDVQGLTAPEAASALGITNSALKSRLHRAREELRRQVRAINPGLGLAAT